MKYEAKKDATTKNPTSVAAGTPWVSVSQYEAKSACTRIGAHLMTDAEWMTVARNIEGVAINDIDEGTAGIQLSRGISSGDSPAEPATGIDGADPIITGCDINEEMGDAANVYSAGSCEIRGDGSYAGDANDNGFYNTGDAWDGTTVYGTYSDANNANDGDGQIRTHILSNSEIMWDVAGNVWEWTDARCANDANAAWDDNAGWLEWSSTTPDLSDYERIVGGSKLYTSANGIGQYYGCTVDGNAFLRGGLWYSGAYAGVFALGLDCSPARAGEYIGFRCAR